MGAIMKQRLLRPGGAKSFVCRFCLSLLILLLAPGQVISQEEPPALACGQSLLEEHRFYQLDFIFWENLAEGELRLATTERPDVLRAELIGRTLGVAAWLTGDRTQRYVSYMQRQADGSLRSLIHEKEIVKYRFGRFASSRKRYRFDYALHKVFLEKEKSGAFHVFKEFDLPPNRQPVDILTGFYNLRNGCYGAMTAGRHLEIPTFSSKGFATIKIEVTAPARRRELPFFAPGGTLLQVTLDAEVFETTDGGMYVWFDDAGRPARGIVENVIGLGDVRAHLRKEVIP
jgi:hypothetical protein